MARLFVLIATINRSSLLSKTIGRLGNQTRQPDGIVVAATTREDVVGLEPASKPIEILFASKGSCRQRNEALDAIGDRADIVVFFDDDFVAAQDYLEQVEKLFERHPEVVGATGTVIADGVKRGGYSYAQAISMLAVDVPPAASVLEPARGLYGCNMAVRLAASKDLRFDEALPLYGWFEDIDYSSRLGRIGALGRSNRLRGVHLGDSNGRSGGLRLGYSQIANIVYLLRKDTVPRKLAWRIMLGNLTANLLRSLAPEPHIDRRGRLRGNVLALCHLLTGRLDPQFILKMD
jgi:GT2 family glycosyltransferase